MLVNFAARKKFCAHGVQIMVRIDVDLERKEVDVLCTVNGRIVNLNARPPRMHEVDTPEKLTDFMRRIDLDRLSMIFAKKEAA